MKIKVPKTHERHMWGERVVLLPPLTAHLGLPGTYLATSPLRLPQRTHLDSMNGPTCPRCWHKGVLGSEETPEPRLGQCTPRPCILGQTFLG